MTEENENNFIQIQAEQLKNSTSFNGKNPSVQEKTPLFSAPPSREERY